MKFVRLIWACALTLSVSPSGRAVGVLKTRSSDPQKGGYVNCATSTAALDVLAQNTAPGENIIVIARLGDAETRHDLSWRRLHNVRAYLTEFTSVGNGRRRPETILLAEGERVKGYGGIDIFVQGQLYKSLRIRPGGDLILGTCYPDPPEKDPCTLKSDRIFYPCRDRYPTKSRPRRRPTTSTATTTAPAATPTTRLRCKN